MLKFCQTITCTDPSTFLLSCTTFFQNQHTMNCLLISLFIFTLGFLISCSKAQQEYSGNSVLSCNSSDEDAPSPAFLYSCNGEYSSCMAFLIFRAQFPYNSVPIIATLTSSNQSEIARINNVTRLDLFPEGTEVIIPVNCSCSRRYYQAVAKYNIQTAYETFFTIANNTYQGLSTCDTLKRSGEEFRLQVDSELEVPLRCACPTKKQAASGIQNLLTYTVTWHDDVLAISKGFNISRKSITEANGFLEEEDPTIFPFTTILVPLPTEPLSRINFTPNYQPSILPLPVSELVRGSRSKTNPLVGGIVAAGSCLLLFLVIFLIVFIFKKRLGRICLTDGKGEADDVSIKDIHVEIASIDRVIKIFKYEELRKATGNFGSKSRIKGCVYRGVIHKEVLAIKKMGKEAYNEVNMLSRINHFNLIKLRGFCEHQGQLFLVFEYMKNGSLWQWLRRKGTKDTKGWPQRIQIALDIANGLLYLHNFAKPTYVHKDINSSNILLDSNLRAKISNFGFARTAVEGTNSNPVTRRVVGTKGYMAPEYINTGLVNSKVDVYAFGVVLLELITGKQAVVVQEGRDMLLSAEIAATVGEYATNGLRNFVDPDLGENGEMEYAFQVVNLSLSCLMQNPVNRPNMDDVVSTLIKIQRNVQKSDCCQ